MDPALLLKAALMGIVEGLTEFLPISSTGHLILFGDLLGLRNAKAAVFEIVIQTGALLAIIWEFRRKIFGSVRGFFTDEQSRRFLTNVGIAFAPAVVMGLLFGSAVKAYLFRPVPVAAAFIVGAFVILWAERRKHDTRIETVDEIRPLDAFKLGLVQCLALIPGTSRSGATIIGGLLLGLSRRAATEFSFFLAIPTLMGAGAYSLYKERDLLSAADVPWFTVGTLTSFISAFVCVRWLLRYIATHDFRVFAWYRIAFGILVLMTAYLGLIDWTVV